MDLSPCTVQVFGVFREEIELKLCHYGWGRDQERQSNMTDILMRYRIGWGYKDTMRKQLSANQEGLDIENTSTKLGSQTTSLLSPEKTHFCCVSIAATLRQSQLTSATFLSHSLQKGCPFPLPAPVIAFMHWTLHSSWYPCPLPPMLILQLHWGQSTCSHFIILEFRCVISFANKLQAFCLLVL